MTGRTTTTTTTDLPPGFRFHPTDEELIMYYLRNQATSKPCPVSIIPEVDIYKFDPWQLPEKAEFGEKEWYFFTPRDRKYPNGVRPNRAAVSGYWKATGTDKAIYSGSKYVGVKKALVFYKGRPPKGVKSDWIMHEYRLSDSRSQPAKHSNGSMRLDDWVLCRIYKKKNLGMSRTVDIKAEEPSDDDHDNSNTGVVAAGPPPDAIKLPRTCSLTHLWEFDHYLSSVSQFFNDNLYAAATNTTTTLDNQNILFRTPQRGNSNENNVSKAVIGDVSQQHSSDALKFQANQSSIFSHHQPIYMNHGFQFQ